MKRPPTPQPHLTVPAGRLTQAAIVVAAVVVLGYFVLHTRAATLVGDLNGDGAVNVLDLSMLLSAWGTTNTSIENNLGHTGPVDIIDLSTLLSHWGQTGPSATPTPSPTPTNQAPPIPTAVPTGFTRAFTADFNTPAPLGSFDSVYSNQFGEYTGCCSTNGITQYSSAKVLSVANGSMYYNLHSEGGTSYAAAPQAWNYNSFTYGQVGMSVRLDSSTGRGYKIAFLLWPETNQWTNEVDFPEVDPDFTAPIRAVSLNTTTAGGSHTFCGPLDTGYALSDNKYHTFLLDWEPGKMTATIDGKLVETFPSSCIPTQPMRLSLQAEGWINQGPVPSATTDVLEVPWVYINTYN